MNRDELLDVYTKAYRHYIEKDNECDMYQMNECLKKLALFGNLIAIDSSSECVQKMAMEYLRHMEEFHSTTINEMEEHVNYKFYPCLCLEGYINKRIAEMEEQIDDNDDENTEKNEKLWADYNNWIQYKRRIHE